MKLLQVTILCLLLSSLCSSDENIDDNITTTSVLNSSTISATKTSVPTQITTSPPDLAMKSTVGTSPTGTTNKETLETPLQPTLSSLTPRVKDEEATSNSVTKEALTTANATVANLPLPDTVPTIQSSQNKTETQSSNTTTDRPASTPKPDDSSKASILPSLSTTIPKNILSSQGTENAKNASSSTSSSSHSSVILPVVIALIVITLSVFVLVGLYRICKKTGPDTPENGNDQPQSDKESVKLLTVKTISHESGEHSAQGKNKN